MATMKINILSRCLGRQVDFNAIIPSYTLARGRTEKFDDIYSPENKYKLLILLHGFTGDCNDYINFSNVVRYAEDNDIVVVMPSCFNSGYANYEYGDKMRSFVAEELVKVCRYMLPVSDRYEDTYIGGLSMGAAGSAKIALAYPEVFSKVLCMSGAPARLGMPRGISLNWFGNDPNVYDSDPDKDDTKLIGTPEDAYFTAKDNIDKKKPLPEFYMTIGSLDFLLSTVRAFKEYIVDLGYKVKYEEVQGYGHQWEFWDLKVKERLYEFFK